LKIPNGCSSISGRAFFLLRGGKGEWVNQDKFIAEIVINYQGLQHFRSYQNATGDFDDN